MPMTARLALPLSILLLLGAVGCRTGDPQPDPPRGATPDPSGDNGDKGEKGDKGDAPKDSDKPADASMSGDAPDPINRETMVLPSGSVYWQKVKQGALTVIVSKDNPPFAYEVEGRLEGYDPDLARALGRSLGVEIKLVARPIESVLDALTADPPEGDIVIANLTATSRRAARANFSVPYLTVTQGALIQRRLVKAENERAEIQRTVYDNYFDLRRFPGIKIGVRRGTSVERRARANFPRAKIRAFPTLEKTFEALTSGKVQAMVHDETTLRSLYRNAGSMRTRFTPLLKPVTRDPIAIAIRKGDLEFLRWLDVWIRDCEAIGFLEDLSGKHLRGGQ